MVNFHTYVYSHGRQHTNFNSNCQILIIILIDKNVKWFSNHTTSSTNLPPLPSPPNKKQKNNTTKIFQYNYSDSWIIKL